jgi:antitoxin component YwqK of YwqJK toxin-antitoxin module
MWIPLLMGLAACSGGSLSVAPPSEPAPPAEEPGGFTCPEGTQLTQNTTPTGAEKFCDRNGQMQGPYLREYSGGKRAAKGSYDRSEPDGDWTWWHENGNESQKGKYVKGRQVGPWTRWHANGRKQEEGDYLSGRKAGTWTTFYESGRKKEFGSYHNDAKTALWTYLFDDEKNSVHKTELWEGGAVKEEKVVNEAPPSDPTDASKAEGKAKAKG